MTWQVPPAASIFSRAVAEKPWACTVSFLEISPWPSTFTGTSLRVARFFSRRASGVTSAPSSKRASRSRRLTGWVCVRPYCSNGIDFFMCGPRSLRIRMWIGFWPPSRLALRFEPEREPAPFSPRPEVLPKPEPSPRPTRLRRWRDPGLGFRLCSPISSAFGSSAIDLHQVGNLREHATHDVAVLLLRGAADLAKTERAERVALLGVGAVDRLDLRVLHLRHQMWPSGSSAAGSAETSAPSGGPVSVVVSSAA